MEIIKGFRMYTCTNVSGSRTGEYSEMLARVDITHCAKMFRCYYIHSSSVVFVVATVV